MCGNLILETLITDNQRARPIGWAECVSTLLLGYGLMNVRTLEAEANLDVWNETSILDQEEMWQLLYK